MGRERSCAPYALNASINNPALHFHFGFGCKNVAVDVYAHKLLLGIRGSTYGTLVKFEYVIERVLNTPYSLLSVNKIVQTTCTDSRLDRCQPLVHLRIDFARNAVVNPVVTV